MYKWHFIEEEKDLGFEYISMVSTYSWNKFTNQSNKINREFKKKFGNPCDFESPTNLKEFVKLCLKHEMLKENRWRQKRIDKLQAEIDNLKYDTKFIELMDK